MSITYRLSTVMHLVRVFHPLLTLQSQPSIVTNGVIFRHHCQAKPKHHRFHQSGDTTSGMSSFITSMTTPIVISKLISEKLTQAITATRKPIFRVSGEQLFSKFVIVLGSPLRPLDNSYLIHSWCTTTI